MPSAGRPAMLAIAPGGPLFAFISPGAEVFSVPIVHRRAVWRRARTWLSAVAGVTLMFGALAGPAFAHGGSAHLSDASVRPRLARPSTPIRFSIVYADRSGEPPAYVRVLIDGHPFEMKAGGTRTADGQGLRFTYARKLLPGRHRIAFLALGANGSVAAARGGTVRIVRKSSGGGGSSNGSGSEPEGGGSGAVGSGAGPAGGLPGSNPGDSAAGPGGGAGSGAGGSGPSPGPGAGGGDDAGGGVGSGEGGTAGGASGGPSSDAAGDPTGAPVGGAGPGDTTAPGSDATDIGGAERHGLGGPAGGAPLGAVVAADDAAAGDPDGPAAGSPDGATAGAVLSSGDSGSGAGGGRSVRDANPAAPTGLEALGIGAGPLDQLLRAYPVMITTSGTAVAWAAFVVFGRRRRDGEPPAPDPVLAANAASGPEPVPAADLVPRPDQGYPVPPGVDPTEAGMPRWRRPSLLLARKTDPLRSASMAVSLTFAEGAIGLVEGKERRRIRYRLVRLMDVPDEARATEIGILDQGDEIQIMESRGTYRLVVCPDGQQGWLHQMVIGDLVDDDEPTDIGPDGIDEDVLAAFLTSRQRTA